MGYSSFCDVPPFDASLFVEFRKRLGLEQINEVNERISKIKQELEKKKQNKNGENDDDNHGNLQYITHKGSFGKTIETGIVKSSKFGRKKPS